MKEVTTFRESSTSGNPVDVYKAISDIQTLVELQGDAFEIGIASDGTAGFGPTMVQDNWNVAANEELDDNGEPTFNLWNDVILMVLSLKELSLLKMIRMRVRPRLRKLRARTEKQVKDWYKELLRQMSTGNDK